MALIIRIVLVPKVRSPTLKLCSQVILKVKKLGYPVNIGSKACRLKLKVCGKMAPICCVALVLRS